MTTTPVATVDPRADLARLARRASAAQVQAERLCYEVASRLEAARGLRQQLTLVRAGDRVLDVEMTMPRPA